MGTLPQTQPRRALVVLMSCFVAAALGAWALGLLGGIFLVGALAFFWVAAWTVPLAVLLPVPKERT